MSDAQEIRAICMVCPHRCVIPEGKTGRCRARGTRNGKVIPLNYGISTALALDPIEKKPLARFYPGSRILSFGSFGCNLNCPFCQNWEISMSDGKEYCQAGREILSENYISPEALVNMAEQLRSNGNIGVAFTYNEPLIGYEFILATARLLREKNLKVVLVTNGCANDEIADEVLPFVDALNIDLKCFRENIYKTVLGGDLKTIQTFIEKASACCHVELTNLVVPGMNDSEEEFRSMVQWIASLPHGEEIPLHITRFFPRYRFREKQPTDRSTILRLVDVARERLKYVYPGNM